MREFKIKLVPKRTRGGLENVKQIVSNIQTLSRKERRGVTGRALPSSSEIARPSVKPHALVVSVVSALGCILQMTAHVKRRHRFLITVLCVVTWSPPECGWMYSLNHLLLG